MKHTHRPTLRGVNLGNWLVLEKWMRPALFDGTDAIDEYTLCQALGDRAERIMQTHRDTYITDDDFAWLKRRGLNAVRIPFGYWLFDPDPPFVSSPGHLDLAVDLAEKHGLSVLLDLHGLPGSQGPNDHTGRSDHFQWHRDPANLQRSLDVIEQVAQRYADRKSVTGFGIINEPEPEVGRDFLVDFYHASCERVRKHMSAEDVAFVIAAYPEGELPRYHNCMGDQPNVWTDVHLYQCFGNDWSNWQLLDYMAYPLKRQAKLQPYIDRGPMIVGEWSMAWAKPQRDQLQQMPDFRRETILRMHGQMQLAMLEAFTGWFFWSYKVDPFYTWSFRDCVTRGYLPDQYAAPIPAAESEPIDVSAATQN